MKNSKLLFSVITCVLSLTIATSANAAPNAKPLPKKQKKVSKAQPTDPRIPTQLPAYKGKTKVVVDFTKEAPASAAVVQSSAALEKSLNDVEDAKRELILTQEKLAARPSATPAVARAKATPVPPAPTPMETITTLAAKATPQPTPHSSPQPTPPLIVATPAPTPSKLVETSSSTINQFEPQVRETDREADRETAKPQNAASTRVSSATRRFMIRGGYLDARYSELGSQSQDLQNGATFFGVSVARERDDLEGRLSLDVAHGLDQSVTVQNVRMTHVSLEIAKFFAAAPARPFIGAALGLASYNVRSMRSNQDSLVTLREHADGSALSLAPIVGVRLMIGDQLTFDIQAEYLFMVGKDDASKLGGTIGSGAFGFAF